MPAKKPAATPSLERIREIAYQLWLDAGCPEGEDTAHWYEAEAVASGEIAAKPARKAAPRRKAA